MFEIQITTNEFSISNFRENAFFAKDSLIYFWLKEKLVEQYFLEEDIFWTCFIKWNASFWNVIPGTIFVFLEIKCNLLYLKGWILSNASSFIFCLFCGIHSKSFSSQVKKVFSIEKFEKRLVVNIFCKLLSSYTWYFYDEI